VLIKLFIIVFMLAIVYTLASSFYFLVVDKGESDRTVRRLSWRIGLSLVLFIMLYAFHLMGWIKPSTPGPIGLKPPAEQLKEP
jgi:hypothetical protein